MQLQNEIAKYAHYLGCRHCDMGRVEVEYALHNECYYLLPVCTGRTCDSSFNLLLNLGAMATAVSSTPSHSEM